jgi:hypothetical protein
LAGRDGIGKVSRIIHPDRGHVVRGYFLVERQDKLNIFYLEILKVIIVFASKSAVTLVDLRNQISRSGSCYVVDAADFEPDIYLDIIQYKRT